MLFSACVRAQDLSNLHFHLRQHFPWHQSELYIFTLSLCLMTSMLWVNTQAFSAQMHVYKPNWLHICTIPGLYIWKHVMQINSSVISWTHIQTIYWSPDSSRYTRVVFLSCPAVKTLVILRMFIRLEYLSCAFLLFYLKRIIYLCYVQSNIQTI